jgi:hypothetical protein
VSQATGARRLGTDPLVPLVSLAVFGALAVLVAPALTWAVLGGLAGYALSGSV